MLEYKSTIPRFAFTNRRKDVQLNQASKLNAPKEKVTKTWKLEKNMAELMKPPGKKEQWRLGTEYGDQNNSPSLHTFNMNPASSAPLALLRNQWVITVGASQTAFLPRRATHSLPQPWIVVVVADSFLLYMWAVDMCGVSTGEPTFPSS
ncbi:hypothetical protein J6590_029630 [Homalodisca vitripennis]|nr:hypothetical protein J6590_029630 [Homalodisca vitripennis]